MFGVIYSEGFIYSKGDAGSLIHELDTLRRDRRCRLLLTGLFTEQFQVSLQLARDREEKIKKLLHTRPYLHSWARSIH